MPGQQEGNSILTFFFNRPASSFTVLRRWFSLGRCHCKSGFGHGVDHPRIDGAPDCRNGEQGLQRIITPPMLELHKVRADSVHESSSKARSLILVTNIQLYRDSIRYSHREVSYIADYCIEPSACIRRYCLLILKTPGKVTG